MDRTEYPFESLVDTCPECFCLVMKSQMENHKQAEHPFMQRCCGNLYLDPALLRVHMRQVHSGAPKV